MQESLSGIISNIGPLSMAYKWIGNNVSLGNSDGY